MSNILLNKSTINKLTSIVRKFWWSDINKDNDSKPICVRAWEEICKPMHKGGLGIRDLALMNKSMVAMMAWRIIKNSNSLISKILKAKYFHNSSIWKANTHIPKSTFWAYVIKILPFILKVCQVQIASGNSCNWTSPWCKDLE